MAYIIDSYAELISVMNERMVADVGGGVPLLHLYGEAGGCTPMPALLETVLLCVCAEMADGAEVAVPSLPRCSAPARARELPLG